MPSTSLPPDNDANIKALAQTIREATEAEIDELARLLLETSDTHPFGQTEFTIRDVAHKIAAKAIEKHLAQKKMATPGPV